MEDLVHQFIAARAGEHPDAKALIHKDQSFSYSALQNEVERFAAAVRAVGLQANDRVAIYLPKLPQTVFGIFGSASADCVFVPVNPLLKPAQVAYILQDCNVRLLLTSAQRLTQLGASLNNCPDLETVLVIEDEPPTQVCDSRISVLGWNAFQQQAKAAVAAAVTGAGAATTTAAVITAASVALIAAGGSNRIDTDMAAILYTSGSTGNPKGVVLSHRNMVAGANSVASYLHNTPADRILAVLPLSFDAGLSQLTTAFSVGACTVLMDYLLPRDVVKAVARHQVTGLAGVPPLWNQLAELEWPEEAKSLRYITNTGGAMPVATTATLQAALPATDVYLMYGLTEAFRSTYLPPEQVAVRPESMGKAIPNAEILVVREDGSVCDANEPGELVHRGALVAMGYWNDPEKTAERFKPCPGQSAELPLREIAVWSGDQVRRDEEGYLYFISRKDEMIKTSGYRVSPTEVEAVVHAMLGVQEVAALGLPHPSIGQAILLVVTTSQPLESADVIKYCQQELPNFMIPQAVCFMDSLPRNQNGKIDRKLLFTQYENRFLEITS